jgi:citrate lyase subunit beta/citryl-CoA lyase
MNEAVRLARSALFVLGNHPHPFDKAASSGADLAVIDLEDAVPAPEKEHARRNAVDYLRRGNRVVVRVNAQGSPHYQNDLAAMTALRPVAVMLPKADAPSVATTATMVGSSPLVALVETARGVCDLNALWDIGGVERVALGALDLAVDIGCHPDRSPIGTAADLLALASASAGLRGPLDAVCSALNRPDELAAQTRAARDRGFTGKLAIHPRQVATIHAGFAPNTDDVAWGTKVTTAVQEGVAVVENCMIDEPVPRRARRIPQLAKKD